MEEGNNGQYDTAINPQENPKDTMAKRWAEQLRTEKKKPGQVVGDLISKGAQMINYVATEEIGWKPTVTEEQRKMILLAGNMYGPRWSAEILKAGLSFLTDINGSRSFKTDSLCMVPYPRFTEDGKVNPSDSQIFLFNGKQVHELQELVGLTPAT